MNLRTSLFIVVFKIDGSLVQRGSLLNRRAPRRAKRVLGSIPAQDKETCRKFVYQGDAVTLGSRWESWVELFKLYMLAASLTETTNEAKAKESILMGSITSEISKTPKKSGDSVTQDEVIAFMTKHLVVKRSLEEQKSVIIN